VLRRVTLATPYGNPGCVPLSNPTKCRKLGLPAGHTDKWKALKPRVKAVNVPKWAQCQESIWESGGEVRDGAGKRVIECEMCTENDKEGRGWERQWK
jgi:hypothetical protein